MEKPVTIDDLMDLSFFGNLKTRGDSVLFVQAVVDQKEDAYAYDIMQYRPGQGIRQLTSRKQASNYVFQNEETIYFTLPGQPADLPAPAKESKEAASPSKGSTRLMKMALDGGEAIECAVLPHPGAALQFVLEDGRIVALVQEGITEDAAGAHPDYEVLDELPWYLNGAGFINKKRSHLYLITPDTGAMEALAAGYSVDSVAYEQGVLYFSGNPDSKCGWNYNGLYAWNIREQKLEVLLETGTFSIEAFRPLKEEILLFATDFQRYGLNENRRMYSINPQTKEMKQAANWDESLGNTVGTDCAVVGGNALCVHHNTLYFTSTIVEHNTLFKYENGAVHQVFAWEGTIHSFGFAGPDDQPGTLYFIGAAPNELQQLWQVVDGQARRLSDFNAQLSDHYIAKAQPVFYENHAGQEQMGWVLYPKDFDPDRQYPGILDIHGGPKTVYGTVFYHEMQVWASKGYFVFFCNPFGSDGQGNAYSYMTNKYGTDDYEDLMRFTDAVLAKIPQIDPARLGVTGGSYGGFMTNWIIGHTDRFAAAATQRSISNWISFYGTSDIGPWFTKDQQGCGLENIEQLWDHSPLKYVRNVKTPTLVIHSDEDYRCPLEQGMQMLTGILEQQVPAKLVLFRKENHDLSRTGKPSHRVRRLQEITDWMEHYAPSTK